MTSKLDTLKANEKAAMQHANSTVKRSEEVRLKHEKAFEKRPSTQTKRRNEAEIEKLVSEVQELRAEHAKLMKKLHANEMKEIKIVENEVHYCPIDRFFDSIILNSLFYIACTCGRLHVSSKSRTSSLKHNLAKMNLGRWKSMIAIRRNCKQR